MAQNQGEGESDWERKLRHRTNRRNDIVQRFRWRRHHNMERDEKNGAPAMNQERSLGRPPKSREPIPLPKSVGAIKDWRYYRRTGATWTDLYNTPERRIKLTGLVTRDSLKADIAGLEHICAVVAEEQRAAQKEEERRHDRARELRKEFLEQINANRRKPGGADYVPKPRQGPHGVLEAEEPEEEPIVLRSPRQAWHQNAGMIKKDNVAHVVGVAKAPPRAQTAQRPRTASPQASPTGSPPVMRRVRSGTRTQKLSKNVHDMDQRRRLFNRLGCQDMKGLLVTDRGLAVHISALAKELQVEVPQYPFIPPTPQLEGARVRK